MRIRSTKPEFWRSERIASVDWDARLVLKGLESYVDDNGVGKHDVVMIVSDVFPRDLAREPSRTLARVSEAISRLSEAGLLHQYEANGDDLLYVAFWESVQRIDKPARGRLPRPDGTLEYGDSQIRESVATPREPSRTLAPGTGEQGNRGTGEQSSSSEIADATLRPEVEHLLDVLDEEIIRNGGKPPKRNKANRDAARLILDRDGRTVEQVEGAIRWAHRDDFWRANILSMSKLREKYETLRLRALSEQEQKQGGGKPSNAAQAAQYALELEARERTALVGIDA